MVNREYEEEYLSVLRFWVLASLTAQPKGMECGYGLGKSLPSMEAKRGYGWMEGVASDLIAMEFSCEVTLLFGVIFDLEILGFY